MIHKWVRFFSKVPTLQKFKKYDLVSIYDLNLFTEYTKITTETESYDVITNIKKFDHLITF